MWIAYRYLVAEYLKYFIFCVVSFVAVLVTTRLEEIAHFAAMGAQSSLIISFALHQIPYILPIAFPISSVIASVVLIQKLSNSQELTVLRASGLSLHSILAPILIIASFLSLANFYIVSELATQSHLESRNLERQLRSLNPLILLQNKHLSSLQGVYVNTLSHSKNGENANDFTLAFWNKQNERIHLMTAKQLRLQGHSLIAENMTLIGVKPSKHSLEAKSTFDDLYIENIALAETSAGDFTQFIKRKPWKIHTDYLSFPQLLVHIRYNKEKLSNLLKLESVNKEEVSHLKKQINKGYTDIARRLSISIAVLTFTLMGLAFGINISRNRSLRGIYLLISLATLYIVCFFMAKGLDYRYLYAWILYLFPHLLIVLFSVRALWKVSRGIE